MSHRWLSTDGDEDQCIGCGVVAPDHGAGVVSDHGPLPWWCPGPEVGIPHHFTDAVEPDTIECARCGYVVTPYTVPGPMNWECTEV